MKTNSRKTADGNQDDRKRKDALNHPDENYQDGKLPGEYPPQEDIMNRLNMTRVGMDVDNFSRSIGTENLIIDERVVSEPNDMLDDQMIDTDEEALNQQGMEHPVPNNMEQEVDGTEKNESDVTADDLQALGPKDLSMDMGDDEELKNRVWPVDMAGGDLDIPGTELDDANEAVGSEDEENNAYSLGGDNHEK